MRSRWTRRCRPTTSASPGRARRPPSSAGGRGGRHHRGGVRRPSATAWSRPASELGRAAARRRPGQPGLRGQGVGHADGRRPAAVRRRRRAGARRAAQVLPRAGRGRRSGSTSSPAPRTCNAEIISEAQRTHGRAGARAGREACPTPLRYLNLGGGFGIPYFERDQPLDLTGRRRATSHELVDGADRPALPEARIVIELGRYIVGECGVYVTRVVDRKVSRGHDLPRRRRRHAPPARGLRQLRPGDPPQLPARRRQPCRTSEPAGGVTVVGCLCTPLDLLGDNVELPAARRSTTSSSSSSRRLRPHRQPDGLPRTPAAGRSPRLDTTKRSETT